MSAAEIWWCCFFCEIVDDCLQVRISMLVRHSMLSFSCTVELRGQRILRILEKDRSSVQLETMRRKYMRRATSVFGKAECSSFPEINKCIRNSVHFIKISFVLVQNGVIVRICFFLVCSLGLFEITECESCTWLLSTDILLDNATRQWHCW